MTFVIVVNMALLCCEHFGQSDVLTATLKIQVTASKQASKQTKKLTLGFLSSSPTCVTFKKEYVVTAIFFMEAVLRAYSLGVRSYLASKWNRLDLFVLATGIVALIIDTAGQSIAINPAFLLGTYT
jgi:hypothetical protein